MKEDENHQNHQKLVLQKYDISNRDKNISMAFIFRMQHEEGVKIIVILSLGSDTLTFNLSYLKQFISSG